MSLPSGFYKTEVIGKLRPPYQVENWIRDKHSPSGYRHFESGFYKPAAKIGLCGGFVAQNEVGDVIDFGSVYVANSGFYTNTAVLTLNMGEVNKHSDSFFNAASGIGTNFKLFNIRFWFSNNFEVAIYNPVFYYRQSASWLKGFNLRPNSPGAQIVPSSMPNTQNLFIKGNQIFMSGVYKDKEFSNFLYLVGKFPSGAIPFALGTYGGPMVGSFTFRFSADWTNIQARVLPGDIE